MSFWVYGRMDGKGHHTVCRKLEELRGMTAEMLLETSGEVSVPVNIEKILRRNGIKSAPMDFTPLEKDVSTKDVNMVGQVLGAVILDKDDVLIVYAKNSRPNRKRFTLAHELAHCCLDTDNLSPDQPHVEFRIDEESSSGKELAANIFAGKLLIPKHKLEEIYDSLIVPLSDVLAKEFQVSVSVMEARLQYLGMPYYSRESAEPAHGA